MDNNPTNNAANAEVVTNNPSTEPQVTTIPKAPEAAPASTESSIEFNETTIMAALSYLGILVFIPFLTKKNNPFVMFHVKQGLVMFALGVLVWVLGWWLWGIAQLLQLFVIILSIIGIVNALRKEEKVLPLVGGYASHIKL